MMNKVIKQLIIPLIALSFTHCSVKINKSDSQTEVAKSYLVTLNTNSPSADLYYKFKFEASVKQIAETQREIQGYEWDLGDGTILQTQEPYIEHSYSTIGDYEVKISLITGFASGVTRKSVETRDAKYLGSSSASLADMLIHATDTITAINIINKEV